MRRWLQAESGGKLPFAVATQVVFPRGTGTCAGTGQTAGAWLCGLTVEAAEAARVPREHAERLVEAVRKFEAKCAAVTLERLARRVLGRALVREAQRMEKHRTNVARELLATERTYVEQLGIMVDLLYRPLATEKRCRGVLSAEEVRTVFSDVEVIATVNRSLLATLEERVGHWTRTTKLGDVFLLMSDYLRVYVDYVKGYSQALETVSAMGETHAFRRFFREQIQKAPPAYANFNFESLLIVPVQRIPRYKMLLADMLKNMPEGHPDHATLAAALRKVGEIADWVNENQRKAERMAKTLQVAESVVGMDEQLLTAARQFVREGLVTEAQVQAPRPRELVLFTDILVVCDPKKRGSGSSSSSLFGSRRRGKMQFFDKYRLHETRAELVPPVAGFYHCFRVWREPDPDGTRSVVYAAATDADAREWVAALTAAIAAATENARKKEDELNRVATSRAQAAAAILSQQYASIRYAGQSHSRLRAESPTSSSAVGAAGGTASLADSGSSTGSTGSAGSTDTESESGAGAGAGPGARYGSLTRKQMTWYSMNAVDKWKIVDEAKAGLENLRQMAAIEESLQQQRAQRAAARNKAAVRARYASIGPGDGSGTDGSSTGSCSSAVAQRFSFGHRTGGSGGAGAGADDDAEKRRSLLVCTPVAEGAGSEGAADDEDDVVFDDAASQCATPAPGPATPQRTPRSPLATGSSQ